MEMLSAALKADGERAWAGERGGQAPPGQIRCGLPQGHGSGTGCHSPWHEQASLPRSRLADAHVSESLLDDYKDYGVNCDKMASEIEDHILEFYPGSGCLDRPAAGLLSAGDPGHWTGREGALGTAPCSTAELEFLIPANVYGLAPAGLTLGCL